MIVRKGMALAGKKIPIEVVSFPPAARETAPDLLGLSTDRCGHAINRPASIFSSVKSGTLMAFELGQ